MRLGVLHRLTAALAVMVAAMAVASSGVHAGAKGKHASFVVDANTGAVLHADKASEPRYPASLTKLMTLYLTFERINDGKLKFSAPVIISHNAATRPPSRLGLAAGSTITVRQAVLALITKSANDAATALAEHLAGSEARFARMMTAKARQLGMNNTTFRNASGLPDAKQITTARDMAKLAMRLRDHFPRHYDLFRTKEFRFQRRRYRNHNTLLGKYRGVDGLKTGYTRASGFNLAASVRRDGRTVIAIVMGGRSARTRNATMRRLLNAHVKTASIVRTRQPNRRIALRSVPRKVARRTRPLARATRPSRATQRKTPTRHAVSRAPAVAWSTRTSPAPKPVRAVAVRQPKIQIAKVRRIAVLPPRERHERSRVRKRVEPRQSRPQRIARDPIADKLARRPGTLHAQATKLASRNANPAPRQLLQRGNRVARRSTLGGSGGLPGSVQIQVGAFLTPADAHRRLESVTAKVGNLLAGTRPLAIRALSGRREVYRARYAGFAPGTAATTCHQLRRLGVDCFVTRSE